MTHKYRIILGVLLCLSLIFNSSIAFALSNRPPRPVTDENGNFVRDPFAEGDAFRNGGLFGPLPDPEWRDLDAIPDEFVEDYEYYGDYYPGEWGWAPRNNRNIFFHKGIYPRDMGFSVDEPHYIAISRRN